jgi:hypothetical protein
LPPSSPEPLLVPLLVISLDDAIVLLELVVLWLLVVPVDGVVSVDELLVVLFPAGPVELETALCWLVELTSGTAVPLVPHAAIAQHAKPNASFRSSVVVVRMVVILLGVVKVTNQRGCCVDRGGAGPGILSRASQPSSDPP